MSERNELDHGHDAQDGYDAELERDIDAAVANDDGTADETGNPEERIDVTELAAPAPITARRKSRVGRIGLMLVTTVIASGWGFNYFGGPDLLESRIARAPRNMDATPAGEQLAVSERYQEGIRKVNLEGAEEAFETPGASFIPIPDKAVEPAMLDIDAPKAKATLKPPKLPAPNKVAVRPTPPEPPAPPEPEVVEVEKVIEKRVFYEVKREVPEPQEDDYSDIDALMKAMQRQANGLNDGYGKAKGEVIIRQEFSPAQENLGRNARQFRQESSLAIDAGTYGADRSIGMEHLRLPTAPSPASPVDRVVLDAGTYGADRTLGADYLTPGGHPNELPVATGVMPKCFNPYGYGPGGVFGCPDTTASGILAKAGDVAYAYIVNGTDTDTPGPLIAEVTSGDLKGARLIGSFTANRETTAMIVSFDRVVLADGTNLPTTAYAVDAIYGDLAIRSKFSGRYFQRYGPRLAGAFLRGAGAAIASTGTQIVGVGDAVTVVSPEQSTREAIAAGVADVGEQLAGEIEELGPDGPLVQLFAGKPIGVLWLANVQRPTQ